MTVWVLILVCINSFFCSQGATWKGEVYYISKTDCEADGKKHAQDYEVVVCIEGSVKK